MFGSKEEGLEIPSLVYINPSVAVESNTFSNIILLLVNVVSSSGLNSVNTLKGKKVVKS